MDKLSPIISQAIDDGDWKPMRVGRDVPYVSHLMFMNDLILFGQANKAKMNCVRVVLNQFCRLFREKD